MVYCGSLFIVAACLFGSWFIVAAARFIEVAAWFIVAAGLFIVTCWPLGIGRQDENSGYHK